MFEINLNINLLSTKHYFNIIENSTSNNFKDSYHHSGKKYYTIIKIK